MKTPLETLRNHVTGARQTPPPEIGENPMSTIEIKSAIEESAKTNTTGAVEIQAHDMAAAMAEVFALCDDCEIEGNDIHGQTDEGDDFRLRVTLIVQ